MRDSIKTPMPVPSGIYSVPEHFKKLSQNSIFWILVGTSLLTILFCYAPQLSALFSFPTQIPVIIDHIWIPAYRILILISVSLAAWQFSFRIGLLTWVVLGSIIVSRLLTDFPVSDYWVDLADIALAVFFAGIAGRQGELQKKLKTTAEELKRQSIRLKAEIYERKRSEERLMIKNTLLETQSETSIDGILATNEYQAVVLCNKRLQEMWRIPVNLLDTRQYDLLFHHMISQTRDPESSKKKAQQQIDDKIHKDRNEIQLGDGRIFDTFTSPLIDGKGIYHGRIWYYRDVTDRKEMEQRLVMTDRLASIGELVAGIAHELNNPLTGVIGYSQLLMEKNIDENIKDDLMVISGEAQRAAHIVKDLLTFARKHPPALQLSQINNIVDDVLKLRSYEHKVNNIEIVKNLNTGLSEVMVDYFQIQQVFLNIVINAEYFMLKAHNRGKLIVSTEEVNGMLRSTFTDDGSGIPPENIRNIFDPFFTTKEVGKGTGLGLSICHGIVTEHGGRIYAKSEYGNGASFIIELPLEMTGLPKV
jgi:signal transduction histidine kinase